MIPPRFADQTSQRDAVAEALRGLVADGTYSKILATYDLAANAVAAVTIDGAHP